MKKKPTRDETKEKLNLTVLKSISVPARERALKVGDNSLSEMVQRLLVDELAREATTDPIILIVQAHAQLDRAVRLLRRSPLTDYDEFLGEGESPRGG